MKNKFTFTDILQVLYKNFKNLKLISRNTVKEGDKLTITYNKDFEKEKKDV